MALLHSFWFSSAIQAFDGVLAKDPSCAMAHWGIAMSWWGNPFGGFRPPKAIEDGTAAVEKAKAANAKTERERDYIAAVGLLYKDAATVDQRTRTLAYEKAMEQIAAKYNDDPEARIYYALSLDQTNLASDKTYTNLLKAAEILETEFQTQPDHPGIAHYIIHSYDVPPLAPKALDAAQRYAKIAPDAPHALHMPSHTFTRVGYWDDSIQSNIASAEAARKDKAPSEELHALDYQTYAYLQTAQDQAAKKVLEQIPAVGAKIQVNAAGGAAAAPAGWYALAAIPARYALERNDWAGAASLTSQETPFPWINAVTPFARALGAARSGNPAAAAKDVEKLNALAAKLKEAKDAYWTGQVEIQAKTASRLDCLRRRQEGRRHRDDARGRGDGGPHREERDLSGSHQARPRAPGRNAPRSGKARGSPQGVRGDDEEGAESLPRRVRRGRRGGEGLQCREGEGVLQTASQDLREGRQGSPPRARGGEEGGDGLIAKLVERSALGDTVSVSPMLV